MSAIYNPSDEVYVKFEINAPTQPDTFYVKLRSNTHITNENFLNYVNAGLYDNTMFHRSIPEFVIQGGGWQAPTVAADQPGSNPVRIPNLFSSIRNEPFNSNTLGTIAMSKLGGQPDSATSQFFFNLVDNANPLDSDNGGYTVFGSVVGDGLAVLRSMESANGGKTWDASTYYSNTALVDLPLWRDPPVSNIIQPQDFIVLKKVSVVDKAEALSTTTPRPTTTTTSTTTTTTTTTSTTTTTTTTTTAAPVPGSIGTKTISTKPTNIKIIQQIESDYLATLFFEISPFEAARAHPFVIHLEVLKTSTGSGGTYEKLPQITVASSASPQDHSAVDIAPSDKQNLSMLGGTVYMCTFRLDTLYESLVPEIDFVNGREFRSYLSHSGAESDYSYFVIDPITNTSSPTVEANTPTLVKRDIAPDHEPFREDFLDASYGQPTLTQPRQLVVFVPPDYVGASPTPPPTETATTTTAIPPDLPVGTRIIDSPKPLGVQISFLSPKFADREFSSDHRLFPGMNINNQYPIINVAFDFLTLHKIFQQIGVDEFARRSGNYLGWDIRMEPVSAGDQMYGWKIEDECDLFGKDHILSSAGVCGSERKMNEINPVIFKFYYIFTPNDVTTLDLNTPNVTLYKFHETTDIHKTLAHSPRNSYTIQQAHYFVNQDSWDRTNDSEVSNAMGNPLRRRGLNENQLLSNTESPFNRESIDSKIFKHGPGKYKIGMSITLGFDEFSSAPIYGKESEIEFNKEILDVVVDAPALDPTNPIAPAPAVTTTTIAPTRITRHVNRFTTSIDLARVPFLEFQSLNTMNETYYSEGDGNLSTYGFRGHNTNQYKNGGLPFTEQQIQENEDLRSIPSILSGGFRRDSNGIPLRQVESNLRNAPILLCEPFLYPDSTTEQGAELQGYYSGNQQWVFNEFYVTMRSGSMMMSAIREIRSRLSRENAIQSDNPVALTNIFVDLILDGSVLTTETLPVWAERSVFSSTAMSTFNGVLKFRVDHLIDHTRIMTQGLNFSYVVRDSRNILQPSNGTITTWNPPCATVPTTTAAPTATTTASPVTTTTTTEPPEWIQIG